MHTSNLLQCSKDHGNLIQRSENILSCEKCEASYPIIEGIVSFLNADLLSRSDIEQKEFYEAMFSDEPMQRGPATESAVNRFWRNTRRVYLERKAASQPVSQIACFIAQLEGISNKAKSGKINVLEIGCGRGTPGTDVCVKYKDQIRYVGVDLAFKPLLALKRAFAHNQMDDYLLVNGDILSEDLKESSFDVVFGRGIVHHFDSKAKQDLAKRVHSLLKPGGSAVFLEPLNTNVFLSSLRLLTRPFRPNLKWEYPFSRKEVKAFEKAFPACQTYYFEGLPLFALLFLFNQRLFRAATAYFTRIDNTYGDNPFYRSLFTKAVFVATRQEGTA